MVLIALLAACWTLSLLNGVDFSDVCDEFDQARMTEAFCFAPHL